MGGNDQNNGGGYGGPWNNGGWNAGKGRKYNNYNNSERLAKEMAEKIQFNKWKSVQEEDREVKK